MLSRVHRLYQVRDIADIILPVINLNQFRIYRNARKEPIGLITWGLFSPEVEKEYLGGKMVLSEAELNSGELIYFTDFIAPYGHARQIARDIKHNVFPNSTGKSMRFSEQGKLKRIFQFHGVNYKKPLN